MAQWLGAPGFNDHTLRSLETCVSCKHTLVLWQMGTEKAVPERALTFSSRMQRKALVLDLERQAVVSVGLLKAATLHNGNSASDTPGHPTVWAQCSGWRSVASSLGQ